MGYLRSALLTLFLVATGLLLAGWTYLEARAQRREVEDELAAQAMVLARSLGPGLTAASNAAREIDEVVIWKLLDNGRLLAEIGVSDPARHERLARIAEANGLDTVAFVDGGGRRTLVLGEDPLDRTVEALADVVSGVSDELILEPIFEDGVEHTAVAVASPGGGAVLVQIHALEARAFARRLGVENLLERLAGNDGVLYLGYREEPTGGSFAAAWDGGELPPAAAPGERLRLLRGRSIFEVEVPLESPAGSRATLRVGLDGEPLRRAAAAAMRRTILVGTVLAALALLGTAFALVSRLRGRERIEAARQLARAETARRRSERLAAAGALTAGLAHEVRSPMNAIGLAAQRLERKLPENDERRAIAKGIRDEVNRLEGVLRQFLELARPVADTREETDLGKLGREVIELLDAEARDERVDLEPLRGRGVAAIDPDAVRRALINLVRNAIQASPAGGRVGIEVAAANGSVVVAVRDQGPGIAPRIADRVFDAFVTGRANGTGLGLALVRRVAEEHRGSIALAPLAGGGTEARLSLPASATE